MSCAEGDVGEWVVNYFAWKVNMLYLPWPTDDIPACGAFCSLVGVNDADLTESFQRNFFTYSEDDCQRWNIGEIILHNIYTFQVMR